MIYPKPLEKMTVDELNEIVRDGETVLKTVKGGRAVFIAARVEEVRKHLAARNN